MKRANERSLAEAVKMRTRGGQGDAVAAAEAPAVESPAPKKKPRAANPDIVARPSTSSRGQPPGHNPSSAESDGLVEESITRVATSSQAADPGVKPEDGFTDGLLLKIGESKLGSKTGGGKVGKKKGSETPAKPAGEIHCHYCGTRESTYWRRGPDGPKTLCNSCGLNWFRQRPMQREQVEKDNLMAKAVAAAALKRPANSLKEGPEKRKREETKTGTKLREQLKAGEGGREKKRQPAGKKQKVELGAGESVQNGAVVQGLKGLNRSEKGSSIRRKLGDAAVKKAALIKRTPSQLSLMGLLETAAAAPETAPEKEPASEAATSKLSGVLKGARFSPLKQAQTRLGAQKLLAVLNVIQKKKGFGRVTSTTSLESVPEEAWPGEHLQSLPESRSGELVDREENEARFLPPDLDDDVAHDGASDRKRTGVRSQRRPNTALLQGASFLPWKVRPRGWGENSSLTFAAAESRLLKAQAAANLPAAKGRPPLHKRSEWRPIDGQDGSPPLGVVSPGRKADAQNGQGAQNKAGGLVGMDEDSDDDGFAGYGVLRKLLEKVDVPSTTSPPSKARPPLNRGQKPAGGLPPQKRNDPVESPPRARAPPSRPGLKGYESFEDLVMGTAGGMKRFESFEDLALRAGPVFARVESFEELALRAGAGIRRLESYEDQPGAGIRRFESFEDLAMRSEPVFEVPTLAAPRNPPGGDVPADVARGSLGSNLQFREHVGFTIGHGKKQRAELDWTVEDGPARKRVDAGLEKSRSFEQGREIDSCAGTLQVKPSRQSGDFTGRQIGPEGRNEVVSGHREPRASEQTSFRPGTLYGPALPDATRLVLTHTPGNTSTGQLDSGLQADQAGRVPTSGNDSNNPSLPQGAPEAVTALKGDHSREGLASQVARLGPRGLSAMALHLLVDCAVDTEPPVDVKMLMQDLETLAIGNAIPGGLNGLLEGVGNGPLEGRVDGLLEGSVTTDRAAVNEVPEGSLLGNRAAVNGLVEGSVHPERGGVNGLVEVGPFQENLVVQGGVNPGAGVNALKTHTEGVSIPPLPAGSVSQQSGKRKETALPLGVTAAGALASVSLPVGQDLERGEMHVAPSLTAVPDATAVPAVADAAAPAGADVAVPAGAHTAMPAVALGVVPAVADLGIPAVRTPQQSVSAVDPELHCAEELQSTEEAPSYHDITQERKPQPTPKTDAAEETRTEAKTPGAGAQPPVIFQTANNEPPDTQA